MSERVTHMFQVYVYEDGSIDWFAAESGPYKMLDSEQRATSTNTLLALIATLEDSPAEYAKQKPEEFEIAHSGGKRRLFKRTGEYRPPQADDWFICEDTQKGKAYKRHAPFYESRSILEPVEEEEEEKHEEYEEFEIAHNGERKLFKRANEYRSPQKGEWFLGETKYKGKANMRKHSGECHPRQILIPVEEEEEEEKHKEFDFEEPEFGTEYYDIEEFNIYPHGRGKFYRTGERRPPKAGEWFILQHSGRARKRDTDHSQPREILKSVD